MLFLGGIRWNWGNQGEQNNSHSRSRNRGREWGFFLFRLVDGVTHPPNGRQEYPRGPSFTIFPHKIIQNTYFVLKNVMFLNNIRLFCLQ